MKPDFGLSDAQMIELFRVVNILCQPGAYAAPLVGSDDQAVAVYRSDGSFIPTAHRFGLAILGALVDEGCVFEPEGDRRMFITRKGRTFRQCVEAVEPA